MFAIFVTVNVKPNCMEPFLAACVEEGEASVREEPNCLRFEILRDKGDRNRVCFIEVFNDEQSLQVHWETPHFEKMWETIKDMIDSGDGETELWDLFQQVEMDFVYSSDSAMAP